MAQGRARAALRAGRPPLRSPGRPPISRRAERQRFWRLIAKGLTSEDAAIAVGVSPVLGTRWFREGGGTPPISLEEPSGRYLSFAEREEIALLRTGRALRVPRARTQGRGKNFVTRDVLISQRPAEANDRAVPGHWEGDLIIGLNSSAIGTLVERTTRYTMLLHLPPMEGHGGPRAKNGPALAGHGAGAVRDAIATTITDLPEHLRRSLTWDQDAEMAHHAQLRIDTGLQIYFADPHSPWQRGTNENTNGLLRQYFPKGTDLSRHSRGDLDAVAAALNGRPRKTLGWRTPAEVFNEQLRLIQQGDSVATTG
ncbi:IS30 family transposase [Kitasatospora sp. GP82]|uniref:IS30 family transposase n=1 Tax=Kitasatospora sp. GP82 TaxID=3035089 RepID=UPI002473E15D|nr:IS30 family transposase [Kitasatospora sp. GP82]MDH6130314.1 IS30 family transposase [Kitasatospora sp. GP82]